MLFYILTVLLCLCNTGTGVYVNDFDGKVDFRCPKQTQTISRVHSIHSNDAEDRKFEFECRDIGMDTGGATASCALSANFENSFDELLAFECHDNAYVNGMMSEHNNVPEDRRWKFYCCSITDIHMFDCNLTPWTNDFDQEQDYNLPTGKAMKGVVSEHDNGPEDRQYKYEICNPIRSQAGQPIVG